MKFEAVDMGAVLLLVASALVIALLRMNKKERR